jgi:hypothetical protein
MSKCELEVHLAEPERVYLPGEEVRGQVLVRVNEPCPCRALTLQFGWHTHGRGNRAESISKSETLFAGEWAPGAEHRYPFRLTTPPGPATYRGTVLNLDHYVTARADIPWSLDPKAEAEVLLAPGEARDYDFGPSYQFPEQRLAVQEKGKKGVAGCGFVVAGIGLVSLLGSLAVLAKAWLSADRPSEPGALIAMLVGAATSLAFNLVCFAIGGALLAFAFWRVLAQKRLGTPEASVEPSVVRPGQRITVRLAIVPPRRVTVTGISADLAGKEEVVSGSGTNRSTHTHPLHAESHPFLSNERTLEAGERLDLSASFQVPEDAPITFAASDNKVEWSVKLTIAVKKWPDWTLDHPITVSP